MQDESSTRSFFHIIKETFIALYPYTDIQNINQIKEKSDTTISHIALLLPSLLYNNLGQTMHLIQFGDAGLENEFIDPAIGKCLNGSVDCFERMRNHTCKLLDHRTQERIIVGDIGIDLLLSMLAQAIVEPRVSSFPGEMG